MSYKRIVDNRPDFDETLADDGTYSLPDATGGVLIVIFDAGADWGLFFYDSSGNVNLLLGSSNVIDSQTDGYYCVYGSGTTITVENKIGSSKNVKIFFVGS